MNFVEFEDDFSEKLVFENTNLSENKNENVQIIHRQESDDQEKQNYVTEIESILSDIHTSLKQKKLNKNDLAKVIKEINSEARQLRIDNYVLNLVHELIFVNFRNDLPLYHTVSWKKIFVLAFLTLLYVCDIFANIIMFAVYIIDRNYLYSVLTFSFYIIPSAFISFSVVRRLQVLKYFRWICIVTNLSPVLCCFHSLNIASKISAKRKENNMEEQTTYYNNLRDMYEVLNKVKQYVGFLHCGPQFTLQLAISIYLCRNGACPTNLSYQIFLLTTSFLGLIIAMETRFNGQILEILWLFPIIVARILSICILVFRFPFFTCTFLSLHWMAAVLWWYFKKVRVIKSQSKIEQFLISTSEAVVGTFIPVKFLRIDIHFCLYIIHFCENILANVIWALTLTKNDHSSYIYALVIGINVTYFLFGFSCKYLASKVL